jgi:hypothetical protein
MSPRSNPTRTSSSIAGMRNSPRSARRSRLSVTYPPSQPCCTGADDASCGWNTTSFASPSRRRVRPEPEGRSPAGRRTASSPRPTPGTRSGPRARAGSRDRSGCAGRRDRKRPRWRRGSSRDVHGAGTTRMSGRARDPQVGQGSRHPWAPATRRRTPGQHSGQPACADARGAGAVLPGRPPSTTSRCLPGLVLRYNGRAMHLPSLRMRPGPGLRPGIARRRHPGAPDVDRAAAR